MSGMSNYRRSHTCGELNQQNTDQEVKLCGWVSHRRDHGGLVFIDLRDRYGVTQIVFDPAQLQGDEKKAYDQAHALRNEYVICVTGRVRARPSGMINAELVTGEIEVLGTDLQVLSEAQTPPFLVDEKKSDVTENTRLKYRYLDLRRPALQRNLIIRHQAITSVREYLNSHQFLEVETPILYKSTPEGARDFVVPSRLSRGEFYALPQSPQTLKQLLMVGGMDRYYQIARCFRDEDFRADRQPEFSQVDIEASFLDQAQIMELLEGMVAKVWKDVLDIEIPKPFPAISYREAMETYGSDRPDTRFELKLQNFSDVFALSEFRVFQMALTKGPRGQTGAVRGLCIDGGAEKFSRKDLDQLQDLASKYGAKGLLWIKVQDDGSFQSPAAKFFKPEECDALKKAASLKPGNLVLIVADAKDKVVMNSLGAIRLELADRLGLLDEAARKKLNFLWVTEFPLLEYDDGDKRFFATHHPFTSPVPAQFDDFREGRDLENIQAAAYDMVLNGVEVGGGSLRIYRPDIQAAMFRALGMDEEEAQRQFGFFIEALQYGTPPHGGIAFGVDRLAALLAGVGPIRDVMAFPKTQKGQCLMSQTPSTVSPEQLTELGISIRK